MNLPDNQPNTPSAGAIKRLQKGCSVFARLLVLVMLLSSGMWSCSNKIPCPKMPKQKKDSAFKPAAEAEGDETNNPNDNKANMTFGGGGLKRDKNGLVKKKKFKNLVSPNAKVRKYTKINKPGGADKTNRNYTKINNPGKKQDRPEYTKINNPGGKQATPEYTDIDNPGKKKKRQKNTKINKPGGSSAKPEYSEPDAPAGSKKKKKKR